MANRVKESTQPREISNYFQLQGPETQKTKWGHLDEEKEKHGPHRLGLHWGFADRLIFCSAFFVHNMGCIN